MLEGPPAIVSDFDDTVVIENVAEILLLQYAGSKWNDARRRYRDKLMTFREYQEEAFLDVTASRHEMMTYAQEKATLRAGFAELSRYCQDNSVPLAIVTIGLDFYVDAVLQREGLSHIPTYTATTIFTTEGIEYSYPYTWDNCILWGTCKCSILESYRARGYSIVYAGDGSSDICAASRADVIFARSHLAASCRAANAPYIQLDDFHVVLDYMKSIEIKEVRP